MALSPYYSDDVVITQLRSYFHYNSMWNIDLIDCLGGITDYNETHYFLQIGEKEFTINKINGAVTLLNPPEKKTEKKTDKKTNKKKSKKKSKKKQKKKSKKK